jgi:predicted lipoprotein with Yx(FWY)xxD motif
MRHPKIIIAGIGFAVLATAGGLTAATASGSAAASTSTASSAAHMPAARMAGPATVRTAPATVGGKTETILVNSRGLPLYIYRPDTATRSLVTGALAQLWPPLTAGAPAGAGLSGKLAVLNGISGRQVTYNGHPLYTFADDQAGHVTGQGVQDFFVATPGIARIGTSAGSAAPAPAAPSGGYGY